MIKNIRLSNFQAHKDSLLEFTKGVNVIKGESHSGKSSIMRAFKWMIFNRPQGDSFKKHGEKEVSVEVSFYNGEKIIRKRTSKENSYQSNVLELSALKSEVPQEIKLLLNMDEINYQSQFDNYFLLQETSGNIAKKLNEIVGLSIIDSTLAKINSLVRKNKNDLEYTKETLKEYNDKIRRIKWAKLADKELCRIEELTEKLEKKKTKKEFIILSLDEIQRYEQEIENIEQWLEVEREKGDINILLNKLVLKKERFE